MADFAGIGRRWQERIDTSPEYTVVSHDNVFRLGLCQYPVKESVFRQHQDLITRLCNKYENVCLEDCFSGMVMNNREGEYYVINSSSIVPDINLDGSLAINLFRQELTLVRGIGPAISARLKARGCKTVDCLAQIRKYYPAASCIIEALTGEPAEVFRLLSARKGAAHPYTLVSSCLFPMHSFRFIDIETLGIFGRPLILIGLGYFDKGVLQVRQLLLRDIGEEVSVLTALPEFITQDTVLVSFNGKSFDLPYIADRMAYYGLSPLPEVPHIDLLHPSRRLWKQVITDCRLGTLEKEFLNVSRSEDLPGALVPEWYSRYMKTHNPGPLLPIVEHNRQDVVSLAFLLSRLVQEWYERLSVT
ncbi:MAG: exonuclease [Methanomicrobiales archaeon]|nr:exonuclease [Methanomicrobiales archaeon]